MIKLENSVTLEQYKLFIESTEKVSNRRLETNKFYISLLGIVISLILFIFQYKNNSTIIFFACLFGILLSFLWLLKLNSFKKLNSAKFRIISKLENTCNFKPYQEEWRILKKNGYSELTNLEGYVPIIFILAFLLLFIFSFC